MEKSGRFWNSIKLEALNEYIEKCEEIEGFWLNDKSYQEIYSEVLSLKVKLDTVLNTNRELLNEMNRLLSLLNGIKRVIISENYLFINVIAIDINGIQSRNVDLSNYLGYPENIKILLGLNGEKLLEKDDQALRYLEELITRSHFLQNEVNKIQAVETNRDSRFKKFR